MSEETPKLTYYQKNKEKCLAQAKAYQEANKEKYKTYFHEYWLKNKEKMTERARAYTKAHRAQINARERAAYHRRNPDRGRLQECRREMVKKVRELIKQDAQDHPLHPSLSVEAVEVQEDQITGPLMIRQEGSFTVSWD